MKSLITTLILIFLSPLTFAHEGHHHHAPSDQPQALYGGFLGEASHVHADSHDHDHVEAMSQRLFFEVVVKKDHFLVYPLQMDKEKKRLSNMTLNEKLSLKKAELTNPRKKETQNLKFEAAKDHWKLTPMKISGKRAMVNLSMFNGGENWQATIQVEKP